MKYFNIKELCSSNTAVSRGIDNSPTSEAVVALSTLVDSVLDPIREIYGKPIRINSGYRCPALNKAVRGVATSQHVKGEAADLNAGSPERNRELFELIKEFGEFDQLIDESNFAWVHVSYKANGVNRKQVLKIG